MTVVTLRDIYDGTVSVVDLPGTNEDNDDPTVKQPRVQLIGIPPSVQLPKNTVVDIKAIVSSNGKSAFLENIKLQKYHLLSFLYKYFARYIIFNLQTRFS